MQIENTIVLAKTTCKPIPAPIGSIDAPYTIDVMEGGFISAPNLINALSVSDISTPNILSALSAGSLAVPNSFTPELSGIVNIPNLLASLANQNIDTPNELTPIADSESPPYPLSHSRILYNNKLIQSTVSPSGAAVTLAPTTYDRFIFSGTTSVTYTLASNQNMDSVGIGAHNLAFIGARVLVEYSSGTSGSFSQFEPDRLATSNNAMMFIRSSSVSVRRLRITFTAGGSGAVGVVYAGEALVMQRASYGGVSPITLNRVTKYDVNTSEAGNWLGRNIQTKGLTSNLSFDRLTAGWYRLYFEPFAGKAREVPFFYAWRYDEYPRETAFCWTTADIRPSNSGGATDHLSVSFGVNAHL